MTVKDGASLLRLVGELQDQKRFQELNWSGSFQDYLDIVANNPRITRNAFQRIYDMIMEYGSEEFDDAKKRLTRYRFFSDQTFDGDDAIFGLEISLMRLVNFFKAAAKGYGTEKRVLLLHGPVGSSKSTIVRRLKRGLEHYSRTENGALYTFDWYLGELPAVSGSLAQALDELGADRDFLTRQDAIADELLSAFIEVKRGEVDRLRQVPHPAEFELYFSP